MFKLKKVSLSNIIKDKVSTSFGYGTQKDRIDEYVANYQKSEINDLKYVMANRNIIISQLKSKIASCDNILSGINEYMRLYDEIKSIAEDEVTKSNSEVMITLYNPDGSIFATSNYDILSKTISLKQNADNVIFLLRQLEKAKEDTILKLINDLIKNKGKIITNNFQLESTDIYYDFLKMDQYLDAGSIVNSQGIPYNFKIYNFDDATMFKDKIKVDQNNVNLIKNNLVIKLNELNRANSNNQNTLDLIESAKQIILNSPDYMIAKASDEYIKRF